MITRRALLGGALGLQAAGTRPNVLLVSCDDLNDWVGCLGGYAGVRTPNIDRLAKRGVLFRNAHCASPLCNPSRTALLTGRRASTTGIYDNDTWWRPVLPDAVTIPMHFKRNGYHVAGAGKVFHHVAGFNPPDQWDDFQMQEFDDPWYRRADWYPWVKKIPAPAGHPFNGLKDFPGEFDWGVLPVEERAYGDQRAVNYAGKFLGRAQAKPFFLAVGLWHPHIPLFAPQKYFDLYRKVRTPEAPANDLDDVPKIGQQLAAARRNEFERILKEDKHEDAVRAYLAAISFADAMVGQILDALEKSAHARNTVVVFWSDNGWHLGEKQHFHKSTLWERSTHVPLIVRAPGVKAGERKQAVSLLDLYPTLTELCGLPKREDNEGLSLAPLLRDANATRPPAVIDYQRGNHAVRTERWRYIRYRDGGEELYDCAADPNEWRNVAGEARHAELKRELAKWIPATDAAPKPGRKELDFDYATWTWKKRP